MISLKIYMDICCYNRPFDDQTQISIRLETEAKLHIQANIRANEYSSVWSYIHELENDANPYEEKRNAIAPWKDVAVEYCPSSDGILSAGKRIMASGIKAKEALHLACAIESGCDYFITTDKGLTNKSVNNIIIVNPIDFVRKMEGLYEN